MARYRIKQFRHGPTKRCIVERRFLFMWWNVRLYHLFDRTFDIRDGQHYVAVKMDEKINGKYNINEIETRLSDSTDPMPVIQENCYSLRQDFLDNATNLSSVWHKGSEKPSIYKDKLTGNTLRTYALCIIWYDGWIEDLCRVTEDHIFISMTSGKTYLPTDFEYWAYTHDLIPKDL